MVAFFQAAERPASLEDLQDTIGAADVVFGVFDDEDAEHGIRYHIIKGEGLLDAVRFTGQPQAVSIKAVKFGCLDEVEAVRRVFGDAAVQH